MFVLIRQAVLGATLCHAVSALAMGVSYSVSTSPSNTNRYTATLEQSNSYTNQQVELLSATSTVEVISPTFLRYETESDGSVFAIYNIRTEWQRQETYRVSDFDEYYLSLECAPCTAPAGDSWTDVTFLIDTPFDVTSYVSFQARPGYVVSPRSGASFAIYAAGTINGIDVNREEANEMLNAKQIELKTDSVGGGYVSHVSFFSRTAYRNVSTRTEWVTNSISNVEQRVLYSAPIPSIPEPESAALGLAGIFTAVALAKRKRQG